MHWYHLLEGINTYTAIPLQVGGFGIAIWQIKKARNSADSARQAIISTQDAIARNNLLLLIPQLRRLEQQLQSAIKGDHRDLVGSHLDDWRYHASTLRGVLEQVGDGTTELLQHVQASVTQARYARLAIQKSSADIVKATRLAQGAIMRVTDEATTIASGLAGKGGADVELHS